MVLNVRFLIVEKKKFFKNFINVLFVGFFIYVLFLIFKIFYVLNNFGYFVF